MANNFFELPEAQQREIINKALKESDLEQFDTVVKAFGGCTKCFGKGYGTATEYINSHPDWFGDNPNRRQNDPMVFCSCDRGNQLKKHIGRIKEAVNA